VWWEPTHRHFVPFKHSIASITNLGKLSEAKLGKLRSSASFLLSRVADYTSSTPVSQVPPTLGPFVKMLEHGLVRLESVWTNFRQMVFSVRDIQRCWLEITAILDYMTIYKPRMDSAVVGAEPSPVADTIGVFTSEVRVAQDFFHAGLPCWLIRPASDRGGVNILKAIRLMSPSDYLVLEQHRFNYPPVFVGPATSSEKNDAIFRFARSFLRYPDPFNTPVDGQEVPPSSLVGSSTMAPHSSANGAGRRSISGPSNQRLTDASRADKNRGKMSYGGRGKGVVARE
jgi:hypothetical protein